MKRKWLAGLVALIACVTVAVAMTGCTMGDYIPVSIASITKTSSDGLVDTYTILYTDGTTDTFTVTNGKDGESFNGRPVSIASIAKSTTSADGLVDSYTILYTDGTTDTFTVTNGKDGASVTPMDLYNTYKEQTGDSDLTYAQFLQAYLTVEEDVTPAASVIARTLLSAVKVFSEYQEREGYAATKPVVSQGAGVVYRIDEDYVYFLTNYHVVYNEDAVGSKVSQSIHCYLYGSESYPSLGEGAYEYDEYAIACEYVGGAATYDVAVVRASKQDVLAINPDVRAITFADGYRVGETAFTVGNPNGDGLSVTQGIVSVENEDIQLDVDGTTRSHRSIRIDVALYHGNSGGGLFNADGELIGLSNAGAETDQNINYAVPLQIVERVAANVMHHAMDGDDSTVGVCKTRLGVTVTEKNSRYVYDEMTGYGRIEAEVTVSEVEQGSIAEALGLETDWVLTHMTVGGKTLELTQNHVIGDLLISAYAGTPISFAYRNGTQTGTTVTYVVTAEDIATVA
jgi:S1-C subfamily serine protease